MTREQAAAIVKQSSSDFDRANQANWFPYRAKDLQSAAVSVKPCAACGTKLYFVPMRNAAREEL